MKNIYEKSPLLPICAEDAPQNTQTLRPECGAGAPAFLSAVYNRSTQAKKRQADVPQYGRSMIEMLGVLAIVGVLSVGGIAGYSKAMQKYRVNKTIDQITQIANGIRTLYSNQKDYYSLASEVLLKAKIVDGVSQNNDPYSLEGSNPFGGKISIIGYAKSSGFSVAIDSISEDACIELLSQDWGDNSSLIAYGKADSSVNPMQAIAAFTSTAKSCTSTADFQCAKDGPMTVEKAMDMCSSGSNNKLGWLFY